MKVFVFYYAESDFRVPGLEFKAAHVKQQLRDKLLQHKEYIAKFGEDMPEIRNWKWGQRSN